MIKKKEYFAHCDTKLYKISQHNHTHIIELTFNEWLNLYHQDEFHWFHSKKFDMKFQTNKINPIYSKAIDYSNIKEIIYEDFLIIFSSFKDYKKYIKYIKNTPFKNEEEKKLLQEIINIPDKMNLEDYRILSLRIGAITKYE